MTRFALAFFTLVFWASTVFAGPSDPFGKALLRRIKSEGFRIETIKTTLLRRIQIVSRSNRNRRQTVYNPVTGKVLRDYIFPIDDDGFLSHVSEILGVELRNGKDGTKTGKGKNGKPIPKNGKSGGNGKGKSGRGNVD